MTNVFGMQGANALGRTVRFQYASPFANSGYFYATSSITSGDFYITNSQPAPNTLLGTVLAPPSSVPFATFISSTNLGVVNAQTVTGIPNNGVQTFPAGQTAYSAQASDNRYQFSTNGQSAGVTGAFVTNTVAAAIPTNFWSSSATLWISNLQAQANMTTNKYVAGSGLASTTNGTGLTTFTANSQTNGFTAIVGIATNTLLQTDRLPGLTNGFVTTTVTNGLAGLNSVTNSTNNFTSIVGSNAVLFLGATNGIGKSPVFFSNLELTNTSGGSPMLGIAPDGGLAVTAPFNNGNRGGILGSNYVAGAPWIYGDGTFITNVSSATNVVGPGLVLITNIVNGASSSLVQVTNIVNALAITNVVGTNQGVLSISGRTAFVGTNWDYAGGSNYLNTVKLASTNGTSVGQTATNLTTEGNVSFGFAGNATNIYSTTNVIKFINAGTGGVTNGVLEWTAALNVYTNRTTTAILTNNPTSWLLETNGTTLYSLSGSSPIGTYAAVSGVGTPFACYSFQFDHNGMLDVGVISLTNIVTIVNTNIQNSTNGFIANGSTGFGTNTSLFTPNLVFSSAQFGASNSVNSGNSANSATLSGISNTITLHSQSVIAGGMFNLMGGGSTSADTISGGASNIISAASFDTIGGGQFNFIGVSSHESTIGGGRDNTVGASGFSSQDSSILGGSWNTASASASGSGGWSSILGGSSNNTYRTYDTVGGVNTVATNDRVFLWSDGTYLVSTTNSQALIAATNGVAINTNNAGTNALEVFGNIDSTVGFSILGVPLATSNTVAGKVAELSGASTNQLATNFTVLGPFAIGNATNFYTSTNVLKFLNAGTSIGTNGTWEWNSTLNVYTNRLTTSIVTNNTTAWLQQTNGVSLYSLAGTNPIGTWTAVSGVGTPQTVYGFYQVLDGQVMLGLFESTNLNYQITNGVAQGLASKITAIGGGGTNNYWTNAILTGALSTNETLKAPVFISATNISSIIVENGGTNYPFLFTNGSYSSGIVLSNAVNFANSLATPTGVNDTNGVVLCGPGVYQADFFGLTTIYLSNTFRFIGSGNASFFGYTNVTQADVGFPISPMPGGEMGNFSANMYLANPAIVPSSGVYYHDITLGFPPNSSTNWCIDGIFYNGCQQQTGRVDNLTVTGPFDSANFSGQIRNARINWVFNNPQWTTYSTPTSVSAQIRGMVLGGGSNMQFTLNNGFITTKCDYTNSPNFVLINPNTPDCSAIEFNGTSNSIVTLHNMKITSTASNFPAFTINFTNGANLNTVYIDAGTTINLGTNVNWQVNGTNTIIFLNANGVTTNWITDGVSNSLITVNRGLFSTSTTNQIYTNSAIVGTVPSADGLSLPLTMNNSTGGRASLAMTYYIIDAVTGTPILTASNNASGQKLSWSMGALAVSETNTTLLPVTSTNTTWTIRNESTGSGTSIGVITNVWTVQ